MSQQEQIGLCRLCMQKRELRNSHIFPKFIYKDFVSDLNAGGQFVSLEEGRKTNKQIKRFWYCEECEQRFGNAENSAKKMLAAVTRSEPVWYGNRLLPFCVSVTLRCLEYEFRKKSFPKRGPLCDARRTWREYLLGRRSSPAPRSQHAFLIVDDKEMYKGAGTVTSQDEGLILCQVGPLYIAGIFDKRLLTSNDIRIWDQSRVDPNGGTLRPVREWRVGTEVTSDFARLLAIHEREACMRVLDQTRANTRRKARSPNRSSM
ncbi:hypothetical protein [Neorhodopirellula lusitana]|uniref:hypothetical protein n=1 Tax=Neorhodopirellula lusitana TaxID=445327 RepID=UPI00385067D6